MGRHRTALRALIAAASCAALSLSIVGCSVSAPTLAPTETTSTLNSATATAPASEQGAESDDESALEAAAQESLVTTAARDAGVDGTVGAVDCWRASNHRIEITPESGSETDQQTDQQTVPQPTPQPGLFRVICRVHYDQQGAERYRDMICVGQFGREPAVESCYPWVPYTDTPSFEDGR